MKNLFLGLIATVIISVNGFANNINNDLPAQTKITKVEGLQQVKVAYSYGNKKIANTKPFNSQAEMEAFVNTEFDKMALEISKLNNAEELTCSATVHVGTANNYIEVTVSGPCSEIAAAVKKLKAQLMAAL